MRLSMFCVAVFMLAGCHSNQSYYDPFLGRTTVPPPGTIQNVPQGTAPTYYQGMPPAGSVPMQGGVPAPMGTPVMTPSTPQGTPPPPGAYGVPQSNLQPAKAMQAGPDEYAVAGTSAIARRSPVVTTPAAGSQVTLAAGQAVPGPTAGQPWQPAPTGAAAAPGTVEPSRLTIPE